MSNAMDLTATRAVRALNNPSDAYTEFQRKPIPILFLAMLATQATIRPVSERSHARRERR
jgi:hypothetical protein